MTSITMMTPSLILLLPLTLKMTWLWINLDLWSLVTLTVSVNIPWYHINILQATLSSTS